MSSKLKEVFGEIIMGYTPIESDFFNKVFYIRHLDNLSSHSINHHRNRFYEKAIKKGLPTKEEKEKEIKDQGLWDDEKERKVFETERYLGGLRLTKTKLFRKAEKDQIIKTIGEEETKLSKLKKEKESLIGITAEELADRRMSEFYIFSCTYSDPDLKNLFFSQSDFDELENKEINQLSEIYTLCSGKFKEKELKKVAVSPMFLNMFYLCDDNPFTFYGVPVSKLTFYQAELFSYGRYFKNLISEMGGKLPQDMEDDPDKLVELFESKKNIEQLLEKGRMRTGEAVSIVGATKEDLEVLSLGATEGRSVNLLAEAMKKGGKLDMAEMMALQG